jgi:photosystem II stability/assembly factor-like uncharacterized protein
MKTYSTFLVLITFMFLETVTVSAQWQQAWNLKKNVRIQSLTANSSTIFAGTYRAGIFASTNDGKDWKPIGIGLTDHDIYSILVTEKIMYAGSGAGRIFLSTDKGNNWSVSFPGISEYPELVIDLIAVTNADSIHSLILFAAITNNGVYSSLDSGKTWNPSSSGLPSVNVTSLIATPKKSDSDTARIYLGMANGVYVLQALSYCLLR